MRWPKLVHTRNKGPIDSRRRWGERLQNCKPGPCWPSTRTARGCALRLCRERI